MTTRVTTTQTDGRCVGRRTDNLGWSSRHKGRQQPNPTSHALTFPSYSTIHTLSHSLHQHRKEGSHRTKGTHGLDADQKTKLEYHAKERESLTHERMNGRTGVFSISYRRRRVTTTSTSNKRYVSTWLLRCGSRQTGQRTHLEEILRPRPLLAPRFFSVRIFSSLTLIATLALGGVVVLGVDGSVFLLQARNIGVSARRREEVRRREER